MPFLAHIIQRIFQIPYPRFIFWNPEPKKMRLTPWGRRAYLTTADKNDIRLSGFLFCFGKTIQSIMIGQCQGKKRQCGGLPHDSGGTFRAIGSSTVYMEIDTFEFHVFMLSCSGHMSIIVNNGVDATTI